MLLLVVLLLLFTGTSSVTGFLASCVERRVVVHSTRLWSESEPTGKEDDTEIQWDLFKRHHAPGSWKGVWTSYNYIGDLVDETVAR